MSTAPLDVTPLGEDEDLLPLDGPHGAARAGKLLLVRPDAELPDYCVKCNKPADGFIRMKEFRWHSPWLYFLILPGLLIYAVVALMVSRKIKIYIPFCADHRRRRRNLIITAWLLLAAGIGSFFATAATKNHDPFIIAGILLLLASLIVGVMAAQTLSIMNIDKEGNGTFKGCCGPFLDNLKEAGYRLDGTRVPPL
jgi:hypothetical protein